MRKNILLLMMSLIYLGAYSQDYQISANGSQSVMACTTGDVYAWGCNGESSADGRLGVGNMSSSSIYRPTKVNMPAEAGKIQHVDGSSGAFLLAINCDGEVWIWGDNGSRQCGNTNATETIVKVPVYLMSGESNPSNPTAKLTGAKAISGGAMTGYAITSDNRLLAWGNGTDGRIGNGSTSNQNLPVYVKTNSSTILENVIMVDGGDNTCYCLVDDDGDGLGTVYSFGRANGFMLGRDGNTSYALPIVKADGSPLDNIKCIAAGDVHGTAIDKDGYVWIWGNNWGGSAPGYNYAVKMEGGETGEPYLQAKSIAGGNGFNMAVTLDGHVVTWGCNGSTDHSGGNLGNGTTSNSPTPVYVRVSSTVLLEDVATVSRGNSWGFARKKDNTIWTWGSNKYGVLGIGQTASNPEVYAKLLDLSNITCGLPDMPPTVSLPADFTACINDDWSYEIVSGPNSGNMYQFTWYKNDVVIPGATSPKLTVTEAGKYTVRIHYVGNTYPCENPPDAVGSVTITEYEPEFSVPTDIEFCGDEVAVHVNGTGIYDLYTSSTGGAYLGRVKGGEDISIAVSSITEKSGDNYTLYVEEVSTAAGVLHPSDDESITTYESYTPLQSSSLITLGEIVSTANMIIDSVDVYLFAGYNASSNVTAKLALYTSTGSSVDSPVAESETFSKTLLGTASTNYVTTAYRCTFKTNFSLGQGPYYLGFSSLSGTANNYFVGKKDAANYPYSSDGNVLTAPAYTWYGNEKTDNDFPFYNIYFHTNPKYCKRMPLTVKSKCSCNEPDDITITATKTAVCDGETTTLTTNNQADATTFDFTWFSGTDITASSLQGPDGGKNSSLANAEAGTYTVLVRDIANPTSCQKTQEITISENPKPTVTISNPGAESYCFGETVTAPLFTFTGTAPFEFTYSDGVNSPVTATATTTTFSPTAPSAVGNYTYKVTALSDANCTATASSLTSAASIEVKHRPTITTAETSGNVCAGNLLSVSCIAENATGATYTWSGPNSYSASTANAVVATSAMMDNSGVYTVVVDLDGCSDEKSTDAVTIYQVPVISELEAISDNVKVCSGESLKFAIRSSTINAVDGGRGTYEWIGANITSVNASQIDVTQDVTIETMASAKVKYISEKGCAAVSPEISATIYPVPNKVAANDLEFSACVGDASIKLVDKISPANGCTLNWYDANQSALNAAPIITTSSALEDGVVYYVSQSANSCESEMTKIVVKVNGSLSPVITATPNGACVGEDITFSLDQDYATYKWSVRSKTTPTVVLETSGLTGDSYEVSVEVTNTNGCSGTGSLEVPIYALPTVSLSVSETAICNKKSTEITATVSEPNGSGVWIGATGTEDYKAQFNATSVGQATVSYVYTSEHGCVGDAAETTITVYAIPSAPTVSDVKYCLGATTSALTATATGTLTWYDSEKQQLTGTPTPSSSSATTTSYFVSQTTNGCESELAQINVTVNALPTPVISASKDEACKGTAITLGLDKTYSSQTWTCTPTNVLNSTSLASPTIQATAETGTYSISVTVKDANECENVSEAKTLEIHPIPQVTLSDLTPKCESENEAQTITATITPDGVAGNGTWNDKVTKLTEYTASFTPSVVKNGSHTVTYDFVSDKGCQAEQVSKTAEVYALPEITLAPSQTEVCQGGNNSDVVTMRTTGTAATGTFAYSSPTLTTLNATNGSFDPKSESTETHTITLLYTDEHSCQDQAQTTVKINARPSVDVTINNKYVNLCDYSPAVELFAIVEGNVTSDGTFSGTGMTGNTFSPSTAGAGGPYQISYNYTDATTQCSSIEVYNVIIVHHTDAPVITSASDSKLNVTNQASVPALTATGTAIKWYLANDTTSAVVATTNEYRHTYVDDGGYMAVNQYVAFATQTENGCQSVPAEAILTITDCSVTAPTAVKYHACVSESGDGIEVTATSTYANPDTENNFGWFFDRTQIPATTVSSLAAANPDGTGVTFTVPQSRLTAEGTATVYVAEYDGTAGTQCFSPATAVTVEVHANPVPVIDDPGMICSETQEVTITYSPGTGSTLSGTGISGDKWTPQFDASATGVTTTTLTLDAEKTWGTGTDVTATCSASTTLDVDVTNVLAPTGTGIGTEQLWSIGSIASLPAMAISYASDLGATLSVKDSTLTVISTSSPVTMYPRISEIGTYTYDVVQMLNGCTSPTAVSTYKIVECPTPTPQPESVSICAGDNLPTLTANGMNNPDYEWIDVNGTTIGTTETLNVASLSGYVSEQGEYTFRVRQNGLDAAGNECWGSYASATVTINPLPVIEIDDIPVQCYDGGEYEVVATVDGVRSSNGLWTIDNATDGVSSAGIISPSFKQNSSDGDFTLKYEFTNATTHCSNSATKDFHVEYVEVPTPINHTGIITDPKTVQVSVSDIEQGAEYHWYAGQSPADVLSSDIPYATGDNPETEVEKSYWVSKSVSGCESGRAEATVTIVNCPWTAPIAENAGVCQYAESKEMTASAPSGVTPIEWHWYDSQKNLIANTQNYTQESTNVDGKTTYYVAYTAMETISGTVCESAPAIVTTQVYRLPIVSFNNLPHVVCYLENEFEIDVKTNYVESNGSGSGVWQITGNSDALNQDGIFSPKVNGSVSDTYTVTYTYTDGKSCSNSVNSTIEVVYLPQPTTENHFSLTSQNIDAEVSSDYVATAQSVHWYDADGRELNSSVVNATGKISWKTGDKGNVVVNKNYYVAQEESGCYSEKSVVNVKIIDCPVPAPITVGAEMCDYDDVPELTASIGEWTNGIRPSGNAEIFRFYDAEGNKLDENTTGVFVPTIDHSTARNYDFYITEWNTNVTPSACESPKTKVSLVVKKPQSASVVVSQESVCEAPEGMNPEMLIVGYSGAGNPLWFEDNPNYPICDAPIRGAGNSFIPSVSTVGENSVWMMIFEDNCYSEPTKLSFTIKPIPEPPTVTESSICEGQNSVALTATPDADGFVSWYLNPSRSRASLLKTNSSTYVPIEKNRGTYTFYATQTVDGCQSATRNVTYTIKPNPGIPTILYNTYNICEYDNPPLLNAIGTDVKWFLSDKTTLANVENDGIGNLYQVEDMTIGKHTFYASQTVEGCESQLADITYYVNKKPATPITTSKTMCEGDEVIPTLLTNLATDTWYADEYATAMISQGTEYTPESVGSENLTYYVMREQNGCHSDTATVTLFVIKQPTFEIDSSMLLRCFSDPIVELHAVNLDEDYHDNSSINGVIRWYFNKKTTEGDSYIPDSADLKIGNNTIYAQYFVTREGATCVSKQQSMTYDVHSNPKPPILGNLPICIGEYLNSKESAGVPIYTEMGCSVIWSSPNIDNGAIHESRMVTISSTTMESFGVGYIPVKATAVDSKVSTCFTEITDSIKISGMPDATIVGNDHLCEGTIGEEYYVQNVSKNTRYNWSITGENQIYTKSDNYQNIRYIDWNHATVDTIAVTVTSEDFCIASDTMVVFVAPKPVASYTWELPGASNVIELTNATLQDSLWYINDLGDSVAIEIPYNMYWNYGHQGEETSQIDEEVEYKYRFSSIKEEGYVYGYNCPILTVENSYGCQSTYRECIFVNISTSLFVPSAFSPSNPAHGVRTFQPKGFNLKECEISVYDKWGNLLWYSNEVSDGMFVGSWDGTCNGKMMASDVYIWKMEATFLDGQTWDGFDVGNGKKSKFGSVTLVR